MTVNTTEQTTPNQSAIERLNELSAQGAFDDTPPELPEVQPLPVELPGGWRLASLKQRHLMAFFDTGIINKEYDNRFRRNYELVKAAIEADFFELPTGVEVGVLDDMDWRDVEMIYIAVNNHATNTMKIPKN